MPVFSEDGKVEMAGSGSEHEFPRCDGHGGADFADTKDVKKPTGEAGFFTVPVRAGNSGRKGNSLQLTLA